MSAPSAQRGLWRRAHFSPFVAARKRHQGCHRGCGACVFGAADEGFTLPLAARTRKTAARKTDALARFRPQPARGSRTRSASPRPRRRAVGPRIARGESTLLLAPTGTGKTLAAFLCVPRPARTDCARRAPARGAARALRLAAQGAGGATSSATCARRSRGSPSRGGAGDGVPLRPARRRDPHRRHAGRGARAPGREPGGHPHHHARVAVPAAHVAARDAAAARSTR